MNVQLTPNLSVTTAHPLSHDGKPVLVVGNGIRLADGCPEQARRWVRRCRAATPATSHF